MLLASIIVIVLLLNEFVESVVALSRMSSKQSLSSVDASPWFMGIDGCEEIDSIGRGSFATVYQVTINGTHGALKLFPNDEDTMLWNCYYEQSVLDIIHTLEKNNNITLPIVHHLQQFINVQCPHLLLEYIDGKDLYKLNYTALFSFDELMLFMLNMIIQIDENILQYIHKWNIYHADIKPSNILFSFFLQKFILIDFGTAVCLRSECLTHPQQLFMYQNFLGTLLYHSPFASKLEGQRRENGLKTGNATFNKNHATKCMAISADYYALAATALNIIGMHCDSIHIHCQLAKELHLMAIRTITGSISDRSPFHDATILKLLWEERIKVINTMKQYDENNQLISKLESWIKCASPFGASACCTVL